jgi:serralysin
MSNGDTADAPPSAIGPGGDAPAPRHDAAAPAKPQKPPPCSLCVAAIFTFAEVAQNPKNPNDRTKKLSIEDTDKMWHHIGSKPGPITLEVSFLNGEEATKKKVMQYAMQWSKISGHAGAGKGANVEFKRVKDNAPFAHIRVRFKANEQWWSYLGTDCVFNASHWERRSEESKADNPDCASMNLDIETETREEVIRRHVIHEFGHALGFMHEHLRTDFPFKLNVEEAKKSPGYKNMSVEDIQRNVLGTVTGPKVKLFGSGTDLDSIMIYPFSADELLGGETVNWNSNLSAKDLTYAREAYP